MEGQNRSQAQPTTKFDANFRTKADLPPWPPDWPEIRDSVLAALDQGWWGSYESPHVDSVRVKAAAIAGTEHCRLVCSGSIGIELGLRAMGIGPGDAVAVCAYDYPGNFRAIEILGAKPILVDASPHGFSMDPGQLQQIRRHEIQAAIASHLYGTSAEITGIREICQTNQWRLLEDACQVPGMQIQGKQAGGHGDVGVFSFGGSKPLTAGNGGAIVTDNQRIASKLDALLDRPSDATPLSAIQAAALLPQFDRLEDCNRLRSATISEISSEIEWLKPLLRNTCPLAESTCYKLAFLSEHRDHVIDKLRQRGLPIGSGFRSMHQSSARRCGKIGGLERSRALGEQVCLIDHRALLLETDQRGPLLEILREPPF